MRKSRLSWSIQRRLIEHFVSGSTARTAASLVGVNKSTAAFYFHRLREIIALESEDASPLFGEIEVDESYFGGHRKGKRGRGAGGKMLPRCFTIDSRRINRAIMCASYLPLYDSTNSLPHVQGRVCRLVFGVLHPTPRSV
jgi:transposase